MPRNINPIFLAELAKGSIRPIVLVSAEFASGTIYMWSGVGPLTWNGQTWTGAGKLGSISSTAESGEVRADSFTVALNGIPADLLPQVLTECRSNKECKVWFGCLDASGAVVADPLLCARGWMDVPSIDTNPQNPSVAITVESRFARLRVAPSMRYTDECQRQKYPTDSFFRFVTQIQDWTGEWGKAVSTASATTWKDPGGTSWRGPDRDEIGKN